MRSGRLPGPRRRRRTAPRRLSRTPSSTVYLFPPLFLYISMYLSLLPYAIAGGRLYAKCIIHLYVVYYKGTQASLTGISPVHAHATSCLLPNHSPSIKHAPEMLQYETLSSPLKTNNPPPSSLFPLPPSRTPGKSLLILTSSSFPCPSQPRTLKGSDPRHHPYPAYGHLPLQPPPPKRHRRRLRIAEALRLFFPLR